MRTINVLATQRISADDRAKIEASDPAIRLIDAGGWFDGEIGETWTAFAAARFLPPGATGSGSREEPRARMLLGSDREFSRLFEQPEKLRLWSEAHGSIRVQEGEPNLRERCKRTETRSGALLLSAQDRNDTRRAK